LKYLKIFVGVIGAAIGLSGYLLIGYALVNWGRPPDAWVYVLAALLGLLATGFLAAGVKGILNGLNYSPAVYSANEPWLNVEAWKNRRIVHGSLFHGFALVLAYVFFGGPAVLFIWGAVDPPASSKIHWIEALVWAAFLVFVLGGLTYWWLRHLRYGDSVCRLLTLPGVLGGWFKAEVECRLPHDSAVPVIVRLKVVDLGLRHAPELWRMESKLTVPVVAGKRSIVPVRLRVPRHPPMRLSAAEFTNYLSGGRCAWILEIEKKTSGVDFFAKFGVPIYDTPHAPPSEQRPE
jgi:hypothetical protein